MKRTKNIKNAILAVLLATFVALPLTGSVTEPTAAQAQTKAVKVNYAPVAAGVYNLDPAHSLIGFAVEHLEINWVEGRFKDFTGTINYNDQDVTKSSVEFSAKIASIDTEVAARDEHLRSGDFFDAAKYLEMTFKSTKIEKAGKDRYVLHGDLTIKGITRRIEFPFTFTGAIKDPWGGTRFGIQAQTKINRRDYGINYGNALAAGGFDVGGEVTINLRLEAVKQEPKTTAAADSGK
ncbi:MAG: YceI family protein [Acidobacteriota bacterium]|nr:YceI family protein [Acidobacteriota bacterium]